MGYFTKDSTGVQTWSALGYFYVQQGESWLVIDAGGPGHGSYFPRIVATCTEKADAERICDALLLVVPEEGA